MVMAIHSFVFFCVAHTADAFIRAGINASNNPNAHDHYNTQTREHMVNVASAQYVLSSAGVSSGEIVVNQWNGVSNPSLASFTTEGVMESSPYMAWGLTKSAWATAGLTDFQSDWEVQFDYSIPSSRNTRWDAYQPYFMLDRGTNFAESCDVCLHVDHRNTVSCHNGGDNQNVLNWVVPTDRQTCVLELRNYDIDYRMVVSRDASTGYVTVQVYRMDTTTLLIDVQVQQNVPFVNDVPFALYLNDMANDWKGVRVVRGGATDPTPSPTSAPTSSPTTAPTSATGDPHLQNIHGERFDLMKPGKHVLINIPRGMGANSAMLRAQADAVRLGVNCGDLYFQVLNVTGSWAEAKQEGGYHYSVSQSDTTSAEWVTFGKVALKVVIARGDKGVQYLNVYAQHLGQSGFAVGGLLGEDDHEEVSTPPEACVKRVSLKKGAGSAIQFPQIGSVAEANSA